MKTRPQGNVSKSNQKVVEESNQKVVEEWNQAISSTSDMPLVMKKKQEQRQGPDWIDEDPDV